MMRRIKVNIFPKNGYTFLELDGTVLTDPRGWQGLIRAVTSYRRRNKLPIGNPADEVHAQVCAANPGMCWEDNETTKQQLKTVSLKGRVLRWMSDVLRHKEKNGVAFVPSSESAAREDVCQKCPFNQALAAEGCGSCKKAVREQRKGIIGGLPRFNRLHACAVLGEDLQASVHLDLPVVDNHELPQHCWRKQR